MDYPISVPSIGLVGGKFVDEDSVSGTPGSLIPAQWGNAVTDEILSVIEAAGFEPSEVNNAQLLLAIKTIIRGAESAVLLDTGVAGSYAAANAIPLSTQPATGFIQRVKIANANPGAATYSPDGIAARPIYGLGLQPLQGGELPAGVVVLMYLVQAGVNGGSGAWILIESLGGALQVAPATKSQQAVNMGQLFGGLKGISRFTSSGSFTVPAGVTTIYVSGCAGGGGGGSCPGGSSACATGGSGGGAGQSVMRLPIAVIPGQVIPCTIGAAGVGSPNYVTPATAGGSTMLGVDGALLKLLGGGAGTTGLNVTGNIGGPYGGVGYPSGGDADDVVPNTQSGGGGYGASGPFGGGGARSRGGSGGSGGSLVNRTAHGFGAGGAGPGGYYVPGPGTGNAGGNGSPGFLTIEW